MKCTCAISGIPFEVPHLTGYNSQALHPALFLPLPKLQHLAESAVFGKANLSQDEIHLLTIATIYQLQQSHGQQSLIILDGSVKPPSMANLLKDSPAKFLPVLMSLFQNLPLLNRASVALNNSHNLPQLVLRNLPDNPLTFANILASIKEYLPELRNAMQDSSNKIKSATSLAAQLISLPRGDGRQKALQDIQLSRLTTSDERTKRKAVKQFLTKFGNLPEFEITSPLTNRNTRCATYWLSLFELSDNELAMIPRKDIEEFREHLVDQDVQSLHAGRIIIEQLDGMLTRKANVLDLSIGMLDMLSDHGASFKVIEDGETNQATESQAKPGQAKSAQAQQQAMQPMTSKERLSLLTKLRSLGKAK